MSVPKPPTSLDNSCSVIFDNTLYSYSPQGFLSLRLEEGARWNQLPMGEKVLGATCVGATPSDASKAGLFVVGGQADSNSYTGLQKFTYSTGNWSTITPSDLVTQNRQWHGSTYIHADDVILVYAGSQTGVRGLSSQTFTIKASEPYNVQGYQSSAIPAVSPIVMSWSSADAAMVSGDGANGNIYWFNPAAGWRDSGASLADFIQKSEDSMDAVLVSGADGAKSLYTFDLSQSPNSVTRAIVQDASGKPISNSATVARQRILPGDGVVKPRDQASDNWPTYNSTFAPTVTRQKFAMAQSSDNLVVFSGGNGAEPIAMFDASRNTWLNATEVFANQKETVQSEPAGTSTQGHPSSTSVTTGGTPANAVGPSVLSVPPLQISDATSSDPTPNTILRITLGTIAGFLILLGLLMFLLRQRRRLQARVEAAQARRASDDTSAQEKELGLAASALLPPSSRHFHRHQHQGSRDSVSSMAILMGRVGQHRGRKMSVGSHRSSTSSVHQQLKGSISKPIPQMQQNPLLQIEDDKGVITAAVIPESPNVSSHGGTSNDGTRRSSGWNRYWSGGSALNLLGFGASKRSTAGSEPSLRSSLGLDHRGRVHESAIVPPLVFQDRPEINRVNSGSPVVSTFPDNVPWREGISGRIEGNRPVSILSSAYSSGVSESIQESWDPTSEGKAWGPGRGPSSVCTSIPSSTEVPSPSGVSKQPRLAMSTLSADLGWLNLGDGRAKH